MVAGVSRIFLRLYRLYRETCVIEPDPVYLHVIITCLVKIIAQYWYVLIGVTVVLGIYEACQTSPPSCTQIGGLLAYGSSSWSTRVVQAQVRATHT